MRSFFNRQNKFQPRAGDGALGEQQIPDDLWVKCPKCGELLYSKELRQNARVCPKCGYHFRVSARERIFLLADDGTFREWDAELRPEDPLHFVDGTGSYQKKVASSSRKAQEPEALITGRVSIGGHEVGLAVCDFDFMGASMGSVFGEKFVRATERCLALRMPLLTVSASGGARMHEGMFSLMQMAKTVAALGRMRRAGLLHVALLTDPCYGGVTASYATVADVILAEPGALIGFSGPRVIEQITKQKLPDGFQTAEFFLSHGMLDQIVARPELRGMIVTLLGHYTRAAARLRPSLATEDLVAAEHETSTVDLTVDPMFGGDVVLGEEAVAIGQSVERTS
jgi:acetyl-CoA carboxylase carboxyl transferase subunit beta